MAVSDHDCRRAFGILRQRRFEQAIIGASRKRAGDGALQRLLGLRDLARDQHGERGRGHKDAQEDPYRRPSEPKVRHAVLVARRGAGTGSRRYGGTPAKLYASIRIPHDNPETSVTRTREGARHAMLKLGYKASAEQFPPRQLLEFAVHAEAVGFDLIMVSDHFQPWRHTDGHAPFSFAWLAALGERTSRALIGTSVVTPTFRYHPAIVAQAIGTLGSLYPGRVLLGVGTGELERGAGNRRRGRRSRNASHGCARRSSSCGGSGARSA